MTSCVKSSSCEDILLSSMARVFIAERRSGCTKEYEYYSCMKIGGLSKTYGDVTPIWCPDETKPGKYNVIAQIRGDESRWTSELSGYKTLGERSVLERLARRKCPVDLHIHFGVCSDLSDFDTFDSAIVLEDVYLSSYSLDSLVAMSASENGPVTETVSISASDAYEVFAVQPIAVAASVTATHTVVDVAACAAVCKDDCYVPCTDFYGFYITAGGDVVIMQSTNGGGVWRSYPFSAPNFDVTQPLRNFHIFCSAEAVIIIGNEIGGARGVAYRVEFDDLDTTNILDFTTATLGHSVIGAQEIDNAIVYFTPDNEVYTLNTKSLVPKQIEGFNASNIITAIDGTDEDNLLTGTASGVLENLRNGRTVSTIRPTDINGAAICTISTVAMRSCNEWYIGTCDGDIYCTTDGGATWNLSAKLGAIPVDIKFATSEIGYALTYNPANIYRTIDGGATWRQVNDERNAINEAGSLWHGLALCKHDPNTFVATGRIGTPTANACAIGILCDHMCDPVGTAAGLLVSGQNC